MRRTRRPKDFSAPGQEQYKTARDLNFHKPGNLDQLLKIKSEQTRHSGTVGLLVALILAEEWYVPSVSKV